MNTTQINNKHYIECDVVMLPTDKAIENGTSIKLTNNKLVKNDRKVMGNKIFDIGWKSSHLAYRPQHLYVLSNQKIKVGDWIGNPNLKNWVPVQYLGGYLTGNEKKIIATTDTSLFKKEKTSTNKHSYIYDTLPQIPKQFIEYYINEYNKGNIVNKVMVKIEILEYGATMPKNFMHYVKPGKGIPIIQGSERVTKWQITNNQNNEISILIPSEKDKIDAFFNSMSHEELKERFQKYDKYSQSELSEIKETFTKQEMLDEFKRLIQLYTTTYVDGDIEEWIKNNC